VGALLFWVAAGAATADSAVVRRVVDGDSLMLADGREVRLIGVNAPEMGRDGAPEQPLARAARTLLASLVEGRKVKLVYETERHDRYRRILAHVLFTDADGTERSAEEALLASGLAWMVAIPPNVGWVSRLQVAESEARSAGRGVWVEPRLAALPVERLGPTTTGFQLVTGTVEHLGQSRYAYYFELAPRVTVVVPREDWARYFANLGNPDQLVGKAVQVRGWVTPHERGLRLRVGHPAMLTFRE
jgi:micrococcal nuclease